MQLALQEFIEQSDVLGKQNAEAEQKPQPPSLKAYVGRAHDCCRWFELSWGSNAAPTTIYVKLLVPPHANLSHWLNANGFDKTRQVHRL